MDAGSQTSACVSRAHGCVSKRANGSVAGLQTEQRGLTEDGRLPSVIESED